VELCLPITVGHKTELKEEDTFLANDDFQLPISLVSFKYYGIFSYTFVTFCFHTTVFSTQIQSKNQPIQLHLHFHHRHHNPISVRSSEMYFLVKKIQATPASRVMFAKSRRRHFSACKMETPLSTYFTPRFSHISQVHCACIAEKTNGFTEQQATWQVGT